MGVLLFKKKKCSPYSRCLNQYIWMFYWWDSCTMVSWSDWSSTGGQVHQMKQTYWAPLDFHKRVLDIISYLSYDHCPPHSGIKIKRPYHYLNITNARSADRLWIILILQIRSVGEKAFWKWKTKKITFTYLLILA